MPVRFADYKYKPPRPIKYEDLGIPDRIIVYLILSILKDMAATGESQLGLARKMRIHVNTFKQILQDMKEINRFVETYTNAVTQQVHYRILKAGEDYHSELAEKIRYRDYVCPVNLEDYCASIEAQCHKLEIKVTQEDIQKICAEEHLILPEKMTRELRTLLVNRRPFLIYGPPGNGKTTITDVLYKLLKYTVYVPYAIYLSGQIYPFYLPKMHISLDHTIPPEEEKELDGRWVYCQPPRVTVHTNFSVDYFDMRGLILPPQVLANLGIMIIDDFGRNPSKNINTKSSTEILNRFISLFEDEIDTLELENGRASFPIKERIVLSSNLRLKDIIDPAFRRRLPFNLEVPNPSPETAESIFISVAKRLGSRQSDSELSSLFKGLAALYRKYNLEIPGSDARDILSYLRAETGSNSNPLTVTAEGLEEAFLKRWDLDKMDGLFQAMASETVHNTGSGKIEGQ